ncbi:MAG: DUF308 domain-containing protein [Leucobacter sp.]
MTWEIVPDGPRSVPPPRRFPWWTLIVVGILVIAAGLGLMLWPFIAASWVLVLLFGSALIANGLALLVGRRGGGGGVAAGVVLVVAGALAIVFSEFTVNALVTFFGVAVIFIGVLWLVIGARLGAAMVLPAVLLIAAGAAALVWPAVALAFVAVLVGIFTLIVGASLIWSGLAIRRTLGL